MLIQFPLFVPSDLSLTAKLNSNISKVALQFYYITCTRDRRGFYSAIVGNERNMSSKLSDVEVLKHHFDKFCRQRKAKFSLLITGKHGVGKSSLVNALGLGTTCEVTSYRGVIEGVNIRFLYSPGLDDGTANNQKYLAEIRRKIKIT